MVCIINEWLCIQNIQSKYKINDVIISLKTTGKFNYEMNRWTKTINKWRKVEANKTQDFKLSWDNFLNLSVCWEK